LGEECVDTETTCKKKKKQVEAIVFPAVSRIQESMNQKEEVKAYEYWVTHLALETPLFSTQALNSYTDRQGDSESPFTIKLFRRYVSNETRIIK
jgi:hypothetical protein